ncbi:MAG: hypothetical protein J4G05_00125 [Chlorobi bacterium]|nr:hypothetical protein [Chlorobiota bacterium]
MSLQITDVLGQEVLSTEVLVDHGRFVGRATESGAYLVQVSLGDRSESVQVQVTIAR